MAGIAPEIDYAIRAALLAMTAKSYAQAQFDDDHEVNALTVTVHRESFNSSVDVELLSGSGHQIGGMSI